MPDRRRPRPLGPQHGPRNPHARAATPRSRAAIRVNRAAIRVDRAAICAVRAAIRVNRAPFSVNRALFSVNRALFSVNRALFRVNRAPFSVNRAPFCVNRAAIRGDRAGMRDGRAAAAAGQQVALGGELGVCLDDDSAGDAELGGKGARRGQARALRQPPADDRLAQSVLGTAPQRAARRGREVEQEIHVRVRFPRMPRPSQTTACASDLASDSCTNLALFGEAKFS